MFIYIEIYLLIEGCMNLKKTNEKIRKEQGHEKD